ncbi:hypothetical protein MMC21_002173 [Puttea exsequens]|nr:hypothetical protein [Puttea exsequens]
MGGIMSAEVALLGTHRILGIINFDTPFLGMHPGVIASGLGSVFRPTPEAPAQQASQAEGSGLESSASSTIEWSNSTSISQSGDSSTTTLPLSLTSSMDLPTKDPNYDPPFANDVRLAQRSGWLNALHFINKHSDGLRAATQAYVKSHMEFGGVMADYKGLKARYEKIRALEDVEQTKVKRVRFVNYYTASTGRPKKPRLTTSAPEGPQSTSAQLGEHSVQAEVEMQRLDLQAPSVRSPSASPKISVQKPDGEVKALGEDSEDCGSEAAEADQNKRNNRNAMLESRPAMKDMDPSPISCGSQEEVYLSPQGTQFTSTSVADPSEGKAAVAVVSSLPPLPAAPEEPSAFDPKLYTDKDARKVAEKEHIRQVKAYKQSVKDRDKAINERRKLHEKKEKNRAKQDKGEGKKTEKERAKLEKQHSKKSDPGVPLVQNTSAASTDDAAESDIGKAEKPKRDKKFCMLPPTYNGRMDPCWVRVFMPGVDEIGAHCGLFFVDGERYEKFVGDVASTIGKWVEDNGRVSAVS